jgi:hypothetical protein
VYPSGPPGSVAGAVSSARGSSAARPAGTGGPCRYQAAPAGPSPWGG